ncbi:hypothetical protein MKW98_006602 [Papaver atlanticum]|uniref:Uncharacterized protein n=1 Tax=Papaver atlanticum TaxID=357466 RepID=A0AAD4T6Z0_9MAGN|nr:hypothetical protein MKW98_006602 [Papaver atlanticum]
MQNEFLMDLNGDLIFGKNEGFKTGTGLFMSFSANCQRQEGPWNQYQQKITVQYQNLWIIKVSVGAVIIRCERR